MGRSARCVFAFLVLACASPPTPLEAQWRVDAQAGRLQYETAPQAATTSIGLGLDRSTGSSAFGVSAGLPFSSDEPVWGALYGSRRFSSEGALRFGVDLGASAFGYRIDAPDTTPLLPLGDLEGDPLTGWGGAVEVMPLVTWTRVVETELRAGVVALTGASNGADRSDRTAFVADGFVGASPFAGLRARAIGRWVDAEEGTFPYAGLSIVWTRGVTVWGSLGRWFADAAETVSWGAGASVRLGNRIALSLNGTHEPIDPVYDSPSRTSWGIGISVWLSDAATVAEPVPALYREGVATIALDADDIDGIPSIAGDFNGWTPEPMERDGEAWVHRVPLPPGVYNYAFVDESGEWFVPQETPGRRSDGMGGYVAVLIIEES